jgi:hypothetical protein
MEAFAGRPALDLADSYYPSAARTGRPVPLTARLGICIGRVLFAKVLGIELAMFALGTWQGRPTAARAYRNFIAIKVRG